MNRRKSKNVVINDQESPSSRFTEERDDIDTSTVTGKNERRPLEESLYTATELGASDAGTFTDLKDIDQP